MRNKTIFLLGFMFVGIEIYAQTNATMVQFPSPEAANLGLVGNLPVNLHAGKVSIDIPINVGNDNKIPPMSLSYNTAGVQPDAHPGWVGTNWTFNAGGVVTRIMNFIPDEVETIGYYYTYPIANSMSNPSSINWGSGGSGCWNELCTLADGCPDEFYINAPGLSGKFMMNNIGRFQMMEDPSIKIDIETTNAADYPRIFDVLEGNTNHPFAGFTITKNDGTRYRFGYLRELIESSCNVVNSVLSGSGYASAWYLAQIINPNRDTVNYTYTTKVQNRTPSGNSNNIIYQKTPNSNGDYTPWDGIGGRISRTATFHAYLKSIESTSTRLDFYTSTSDELKNGAIDMGNWKKLDSVVVYNKIAAAREKSFAFAYDPATNKRLKLLSITEKGLSGSLPPHQFAYNDAVKLPPYQSAQTDFWGYYNASQDSTSVPTITWPELTMPFYYSLNREPNPAVIGAGLLTRITYPTGGSDSLVYEPNDYSFFYDYSFSTGPFYFGVNWKWDAAATNKILYKFGSSDGSGEVVQFFEITTPAYGTVSGNGIKRTVILPPGHYDIESLQRFLNVPVDTRDMVTYFFTYKLLKPYSVAKALGPGMRIKKICLKSSATNIDLVHEYIYSKDYGKPSYDPASSSGILGNRPNFVVFPNGTKAGGESSCGTPQGPVAMTEGSPIGYSEVTEITKDKSGNILGFVTNKYTNFDTHPDDVPAGLGNGYITFGQKGNRGFERGKLVESAICDQSGKILKKVTNTYTFFSPSFVSNGIAMRSNFFATDNVIHGTEIYMLTRNYFSTCKVSSSTEATFDAAGSNSVAQYTSYFYNQFKLPSSTTLRTSKGEDKKTVYRYPFDISSPIYDAMTRRNMLNYPVETINYLDSNIIGSALTTYLPVIFTNDTMYLTEKVYKLEINGPLNSFTQFNGSGKDPHYSSPSLEVTRYDGNGNPLEIKDQSGIVTAFLWGYSNQLPVAKVVGSDNTTVKSFINQAILDNPATTDQQMRAELNKIRNGLSGAKALVTTYTYKPLVGMTSNCDINNRISYYEYDGLGRLKVIKDQDGNVIKTIDYHYKGQ